MKFVLPWKTEKQHGWSHTLPEALERILEAHTAYYNVKREGIEPPFVAEAEFDYHGEQYFLMKSAKLNEIDSKEYVFFATMEELKTEEFERLDSLAWERGTSRVVLGPNHRSTDVLLVLLAERIEPELFDRIPRCSRYKSYKSGLQGWSHYCLIAVELSTGRMVYNRQGRRLEKSLRNTLNNTKGN